jgi:hypothetical protein
MLMLADRGLFDFDRSQSHLLARVRSQRQGEGLLVRHVMGHTAGLSGLNSPLPSICQRHRVSRSASPHKHRGGSQTHRAIIIAITLDHPGRDPATHHRADPSAISFRTEVAELPGADFHIGLDPKHDARVGGELRARGAFLSMPTSRPDRSASRTPESC